MNRALSSLGAVLILAASVAPAGAADRNWHLRVFGTWMDARLGGTVVSGDGTDVSVGAADALGFGGAVEFQFGGRLGLELGLLSASPGLELSADLPGVGGLVVEDSLSSQALTIDLDVHLTGADSGLDAYLGAGYARVFFGELAYDVPGYPSLDFHSEDGSGWTIKVGVEYAFGDGAWGLTAGLRYIGTGFEASQRGDPTSGSMTFDNDLFVAAAGVAFSF